MNNNLIFFFVIFKTDENFFLLSKIFLKTNKNKNSKPYGKQNWRGFQIIHFFFYICRDDDDFFVLFLNSRKSLF